MLLIIKIDFVTANLPTIVQKLSSARIVPLIIKIDFVSPMLDQSVLNFQFSQNPYESLKESKYVYPKRIVLLIIKIDFVSHAAQGWIGVFSSDKFLRILRNPEKSLSILKRIKM